MAYSTNTLGKDGLHYDLYCVSDGRPVEENYALSCPDQPESLIRARYHKKRLVPYERDSIFKFKGWLPVGGEISSRARPVVFRSEKLADCLGLSDLWISFTGYYPERSAYALSGSFKELEALPTYSRLHRFTDASVVVASAGNTARAFAQIGNAAGKRNVIVVPEKASDRIAVTEDNGMTALISVRGDYSDAIAVSDRIAAMGGFVSEGGVRNIARRDGMGTVMLEAAITLGRLPDHYFQAVGSGTGGIAAWEASMRLIEDGRFGNRLPRLELAQNLPFAPMVKAWNARRRELVGSDLGDGHEDEGRVYADVLTNREPPYSLAGGVYDAMIATDGRFYGVSNGKAGEAERLWMEYENVRPDPAASVALASLIQATENREVCKRDCILLNMTGGGAERAKEDFDMVNITATAQVPPDVDDASLKEALYV